MLPVSLDCPFSLPLRYSLTFICPVSCVPYVASFSGLSFSLLPLRYSLTGICPVSCVPYVASFSGLFFFIAPSVFSNIYLSCVLCTLCCQFLWIVLVYFRYSLTCICPVSCVPYVASFSGTLPLRYSLTFICPVSCVPYDCHFGISNCICPFAPYVASFSGLSFLLPFRYSLTCICPVSSAPYVASFSGLSFFITLSVFSNMYLSCVLCTLCCQFLWIVHF